MIFDINNDLDLQVLRHAEREKQNIGLTSGCFDMLHAMHLLYLERCKRECGYLIVGIDSDATVQRNKGRLPAIHEQERLLMVAALRCVDAAFILKDANLDFPLIVEGFDSPGDVIIFKHSDLIYGSQAVMSDQVVIVPDVTPTISSTELKRRLSQATQHLAEGRDSQEPQKRKKRT